MVPYLVQDNPQVGVITKQLDRMVRAHLWVIHFTMTYESHVVNPSPLPNDDEELAATVGSSFVRRVGVIDGESLLDETISTVLQGSPELWSSDCSHF